MSEETTPAAPAAKEPVAAGRSAAEIFGDPLVAAAVASDRDAFLDAKEFAGEITLTVRREKIREVCAAFKADSFNYLVDLCGVDYSTYPGWTGERFGVTYHLYSFPKNNRVRLKVTVADGGAVPSVSPVWKTANWHEREAFDMFGILFEGHPNLERILMWEGFNGHPLRKDFPLRGIDTGARIYPEVFPQGGGPKEGSTGKNPKDVNILEGGWTAFGVGPAAQIPTNGDGTKPSPQLPPAADGQGK